MKKLIQSKYANYKVWKYYKIKKFFEAFTILKYVKENGEFPHGDDEYNRILGKENQCI